MEMALLLLLLQVLVIVVILVAHVIYLRVYFLLQSFLLLFELLLSHLLLLSLLYTKSVECPVSAGWYEAELRRGLHFYIFLLLLVLDLTAVRFVVLLTLQRKLFYVQFFSIAARI